MNIKIFFLLLLIFKDTSCLINKKILSKGNGKTVTRISHQDYELIELKYSRTNDEFETELKTLNSLNHENIISIIDYNENEQIIIEEAGACSLLNFIKNPNYFFEKYNFTETQNIDEIRVDIIEQIMSGLKFIHKNGYVHLDIKPQNFVVFFDDKIVVKFIDFSASKKILKNKICENRIVGTFEYLPPESIDKALYKKRYKINYSYDVYSLALTINFILTGKTIGELADRKIYEIYKAETNEESERCFIDLIKYRNWRPPLNPNSCFEYINEIINICWQKNSKERPTIKQIYKMFNLI